MALFGCAPKRPLDYLGSAGLLWAINGGRLAELHGNWAVIDVPLQIPAHLLPSKCRYGQNHFALGEAVRSACAAGASQSWRSPEPIDVPCRRVCPAIGVE